MIAVFVMLIGIGFLTLVIGAVSQRFVTPELEEAAEVDEGIVTTETEILRELREIMDRLHRLEASLQRVGRTG